MTPKISMIRISKILPAMAKEPMAQRMKTMGIRIEFRTFKTLTIVRTIESPRTSMAKVAMRNMAETS